MSDLSQNPLALEELLLRVLSGEATDDELALLNQSLEDSAALRSSACQFLCDDALTTELFVTRKQADSILKQLRVSETPTETGPITVFAPQGRDSLRVDNSRACPAHAPGKRTLQSKPLAGLGSPMFRYINRHGIAVGAVAATLLVGLLFYNASLRSKLQRLHNLAVVAQGKAKIGKDRDARPDGTQEADHQREIIGRISGLNKPVWAAGTTPLSFGDRIKRGQTLELESGVVELLLSTGAKVTVEGPTRFEATSELEATLSQGKIAAAAPRVARGYTVLTPTAELVDIGTQFGVRVEDSGDSELHVFDGDVIARSRLAVGSSTLIHAKEDEAMRFNSVSAEPLRFAAQERVFVRHVAPLHGPEELPPIPTTAGLSLWYAADMCTGLRVGERVRTWRDLLVGENDFADDAWQFDEARCPTFVKDGNGRPALRFDGWSTYLATSPMEATERQTMFVVCAPAPINYANDHHGQMLLKYGDAPSLELSVLPDFSARGWVWPGPGNANVGEVRSKPVERGSPVVVAYEYNSADNRAQLWVNGVLQGHAEAPIPVLAPDRKYIGSHIDPHLRTVFFGSLYEIIIFDKAFDAEQMPEFTRYFSTRYGIE